MADFKQTYNKSMNHEGSYSNDPTDRGGETWKGISRKNFPEWGGWAIIDGVVEKELGDKELNKTITKAIDKKLKASKELETLVQDFYKAEFWDRLMLDLIESQAIADELFDTAINTGLNTAARHLQHALNLMNRNQKDYADLKTDGKIGERTIKCFNALLKTAETIKGRTLPMIEKTILKALNGMQFNLYAEICRKDPTQETFFFGWVNNRIE